MRNLGDGVGKVFILILLDLYFALAVKRTGKLLFLGFAGGVAEGSSVYIWSYRAVIETENI